MLPGSFPAPDLQSPSKASPQNLAKSHPNKTLILRFSVHNAKQSCSDTIYDRVASSGARLTTPPQTRTDPQGLQLSYICQVRLLGVVSPTSPTTCHHVCQRRRDRPTAAPNDLMSRHTRKRLAELGRNPTDATAPCIHRLHRCAAGSARCGPPRRSWRSARRHCSPARRKTRGLETISSRRYLNQACCGKQINTYLQMEIQGLAILYPFLYFIWFTRH